MQIIFYLDESTTSVALETCLKNEGFRVKTASTERLKGAEDKIHVGFAMQNNYIFITDDKRLEPILKNQNRPGTFIINQTLIQRKRFQYIVKIINYYLNLYTVEEIINFGYVFKIY